MTTKEQDKDLQQKLEYARKLERKARMQECLPHLYGFKFYNWAYEYFHSKRHYCFVCAANQIGKSTVQIRKAIHWATHPDLWPDLWATKPSIFWYLYPNKDVATVEFEEKWVKEILPREEFKDHPVYGWTAEYQQKKIYSCRFNSGVTIYFKTYEQDVHALQTATCHAIWADEEIPVDLLPELQMRLAAVAGYFSLVFTATKGQEYFRQVMECKGKDERHQEAFKVSVSMWDCLNFRDSTKSHWTPQRVEEIQNACKDQAEIDRRVNGRFVVDKNRMYSGFIRTVNMTEDHPLPKDWHIYTGVDVGSGGTGGHPGAICFLGVSPDFQKGRVFKCWRGDRIVTTAGDLVRQYRLMKGKMRPVSQTYDWQSKDFFTIAQRMGEPFIPAEKNRERGEQTLNVLFRSEMLKIYQSPEAFKLAVELENLKRSTKKSDAKDDLIDALRFCCMAVPWDFSVLNGPRVKKKDPLEGLDERQRNYELQKQGKLKQESEALFDDFDEINDAYDFLGYDEGFIS